MGKDFKSGKHNLWSDKTKMEVAAIISTVISLKTSSQMWSTEVAALGFAAGGTGALYSMEIRQQVKAWKQTSLPNVEIKWFKDKGLMICSCHQQVLASVHKKRCRQVHPSL